MIQRLLVALFFALEQYLAALVDRHRKKLKEEEERAELGEKIDSGDEPLWRPNVYLYSPTPDNHCQFVNGAGHVLDCDEPLIHDHFLAPLEDLVTLKSKLHQCETWR